MRWLSLIEAIDHIGVTQRCTPIEAQRHLKAKIGASIVPVKWVDADGANDIPNPSYLLGTKLILSGSGLAYDKEAEEYRPLLVLRSAVLAAWQHGKSESEPSNEFVRVRGSTSRNKHENERMKWMTLVEAEEHIEVLQKCDSLEALRQLKEEIGHGMVAVKWADSGAKPGDDPDVSKLKTSETIPTGPGFAPDGKKYRPLLILRADILRLWPELHDSIEQMSGEQLSTKSRPGPRSTRDEIWAALSEMQRENLLP